MASKDGFLTQEQREMLKIATASLNSENPIASAAPSPKSLVSPRSLSSSPKPTSTLLSDHHGKGHGGGGKAPAVRHVRRSHSGKVVRVKKGRLLVCLSNFSVT